MVAHPFIHDDFLLRSAMAQQLYHEHARAVPIVDYHNHLSPAELAADRAYENLCALWVASDPYKHRAMRMCGVPEAAITGACPDEEKFQRWAATVPQLVGSPVHQWAALELKRFFGIDELLSPANARAIWEECNRQLAGPGHTARGLLAHAGVACACTSDRLLDDLTAHERLARDERRFRVLPSLRADDIVAVAAADFPLWVQRLGRATGILIRDFDGFVAAVRSRLEVFSRLGCRLSDHGLDDFCHEKVSEAETAALFARRLSDETLGQRELGQLRSGLLRFLGTEYAQRGWIMQLHVGALRGTSSRLRALAGPAGGYAGIAGPCDVAALVTWLDDLEGAGGLPRTVLFPLNPGDFAPLAALAGSFAEDGVAGKLQLGPAWWFNDHTTGIRSQLEAIANYGTLALSIGMTTDARCPLSMARHEYFRRVFCDWLAEQAEAGAMPAAADELGALVRAVCGENAQRYLAL